MKVPHTWNREGADYDYLGTGWYFRKFDLPKLPVDAIAQLHFGATFYKARVWVNGAEIGAHEGGYRRIRSTSRRSCSDNLLVGAPSTTVPACSRFRASARGARRMPGTTGGRTAASCATRGSAVHGPVRVDRQFIRSKLEGETATVNNRVTLTSRGAR